jgi:hypothetical protein
LSYGGLRASRHAVASRGRSSPEAHDRRSGGRNRRCTTGGTTGPTAGRPRAFRNSRRVLHDCSAGRRRIGAHHRLFLCGDEPIRSVRADSPAARSHEAGLQRGGLGGAAGSLDPTLPADSELSPALAGWRRSGSTSTATSNGPSGGVSSSRSPTRDIRRAPARTRSWAVRSPAPAGSGSPTS